MKAAIMQPYFFPYIGYFQLINSVDQFIIYDTVEYTKKGWINRNRFLNNGKADYFSLPLKKDSDYLSINDRYLSDHWETDKKKLKNKIKNSYLKAPFFSETYYLFEKCIDYEDKNLFNFILYSLNEICKYLEISTTITKYSDLSIDSMLKSKDKVLAICKKINTKTYINPIGGIELYDKEEFLQNNFELKFLKSNQIIYKQFKNDFEPYLSILDLLMFNEKEKVINFIKTEFTYL